MGVSFSFYKARMSLTLSLVLHLKNLLSPRSFSAFNKFFLLLSSFRPFRFLMMIRPSSLHSPISMLLIMFDCWESIRAPASSYTLFPSKLTTVTSNCLLLGFLSMVCCRGRGVPGGSAL